MEANVSSGRKRPRLDQQEGWGSLVEEEPSSAAAWRSRVEAALGKLQEAAEARKGLLEARAESLKKSREALAQEIAQAKEAWGATPPPTPDAWVKVNVGGVVTAYRRSAFAMETAAKDQSYLGALLGSGDWEKKLPRDRAGNIFIDESPAVFQAVMSANMAAKVSSLASDQCTSYLRISLPSESGDWPRPF